MNDMYHSTRGSVLPCMWHRERRSQHFHSTPWSGSPHGRQSQKSSYIETYKAIAAGSNGQIIEYTMNPQSKLSAASALLRLLSLAEVDLGGFLALLGVARAAPCSPGRRLRSDSVQRDRLRCTESAYGPAGVSTRDAPMSVNSSPTFCPVFADASQNSRLLSLAYASASAVVTCLKWSPAGVLEV